MNVSLNMDVFLYNVNKAQFLSCFLVKFVFIAKRKNKKYNKSRFWTGEP